MMSQIVFNSLKSKLVFSEESVSVTITQTEAKELKKLMEKDQNEKLYCILISKPFRLTFVSWQCSHCDFSSFSKGPEIHTQTMYIKLLTNLYVLMNIAPKSLTAFLISIVILNLITTVNNFIFL